MPTLTVNLDAAGARRLLDRAAAQAQASAPLFAIVANRLRNDTMRNFREGGWYPGKWPMSRRAAGMTRGRTLVQRGTLSRSISARSGAGFAKVGTSVKYARIHQFGGTINHPGGTPYITTGRAFAGSVSWLKKDGDYPPGTKFTRAHQIPIPARPFLPVRDGMLHPDTVRFIAEAAARHLGVS